MKNVNSVNQFKSQKVCGSSSAKRFCQLFDALLRRKTVVRDYIYHLDEKKRLNIDVSCHIISYIYYANQTIFTRKRESIKITHGEMVHKLHTCSTDDIIKCSYQKNKYVGCGPSYCWTEMYAGRVACFS